ncbi:hypothetical protein Poli38472_012883 [Pythium oligandrum]|uniref:PHD-type domain-containing protein n=1 Tax=Pythium oligandrum TaxID=41045 RepID=A0A8K1FIV8_PYTOL|nr:hypothetical protein Poli38472_012883 [Pythium oligandrum]|eukprot:TMW64261.1 hypothetical protein Poli38472_012883 [Pythium oligandrum]
MPTNRRGGRKAKANQPVKDSNSSSSERPGTRQLPARERKPRVTYTPTVAPTRHYRRRQEVDKSTPDAQYRRLEARVRSQVKQLKYHETFLDAYEGEGWRRASREKLKPQKEIEVARSKILKGKRAIMDTLMALEEAQRSQEPQIPYLLELAKNSHREHDPENEQIYCSRCGSTNTTEDNDILLCDSEGCCRAYHQQCQLPVVATSDIPDGDEPWYCCACLARFNSLKTINYAFGTTCERVADVFPGLTNEEAMLGVATVAVEDDDEEDDEDFAVSGEEEEDDDDDDDDEVVDEEEEEGQGEDAEVTVAEENVSDEELQFLRTSDVIDQDRRSTRSQRHQATTSDDGLLGRQVQTEDGKRGVVVEQEESKTETIWRVVFYDGTMVLMAMSEVEDVVARAEKHDAESTEEGDGKEVDKSLIMKGKRKRKRVNYRALNDLLFAGKQDSDEEAEVSDGSPMAGVQGGEDEDDEDYTPATVTKENTGTPKRGRRTRQPVDYRSMHEGVLTC